MFQRLVLRLCLTPLLTAGAVLGSAIVAGGAAHAGAAATADPHPAQPIAPSAFALPVVLEAPAPLLVARGAATGPLFTAYGSRARLDFDAAGVTITQYGPRPPDLAGRLLWGSASGRKVSRRVAWLAGPVGASPCHSATGP